MRKQDFSERSEGELQPTFATRPDIDITHGFVPCPLPPDWKWPDDLWPLLLEAHKALAKLDGISQHLPSPELILRPLQRREAQKSSRLEGTITNPEQQALFEVDPDISAPDEEVSAFREVDNYAKALQQSRQLRSELPISLRLIRRLHETLMTGVRGQENHPGRFRTVQNLIGSPPRFVPPPPDYLNNTLDAFEKYLYAEKTFDPLVEAFLVHYQFETIHPFGDGNGRVGRLLLAILIEEWCDLSNQWLYMSDYFDRNKDDYTGYLYRVSSEGDWKGWVSFCLQGVIEQAKDTQLRCGHLIDLHKDLHARVNEAGGSVRLSQIVDNLFIVPAVVPARLKDALDVAYPTARSDVDKLDELGILRELPDAKHITYYCPAILHTIHAENLPPRVGDDARAEQSEEAIEAASPAS